MSASWGQKGLVPWSLSNFVSRTRTESLTGTVANSHSTSKDIMIWLSWMIALEILMMKCTEFFTMSTELDQRENEMSSNKADELWVKVWTQDSMDLRRMALFAWYFKHIVHPRWISVSGLTLLLTVCEASLIGCGSYGRSGLPWCTGTVQSQFSATKLSGVRGTSTAALGLAIAWVDSKLPKWHL